MSALGQKQTSQRVRVMSALVTKPIDFDLLAMIIETRLKAVARTGLWPKTVALNERVA